MTVLQRTEYLLWRPCGFDFIYALYDDHATSFAFQVSTSNAGFFGNNEVTSKESRAE